MTEEDMVPKIVQPPPPPAAPKPLTKWEDFTERIAIGGEVAGAIAGFALGVVVCLGILYGLVRFIAFAWAG